MFVYTDPHAFVPIFFLGSCLPLETADFETLVVETHKESRTRNCASKRAPPTSRRMESRGHKGDHDKDHHGGRRGFRGTAENAKTKLCLRWQSPEGCRFGDRCNFAHGESELRKLPSRQTKCVSVPAPGHAAQQRGSGAATVSVPRSHEAQGVASGRQQQQQQQHRQVPEGRQATPHQAPHQAPPPHGLQAAPPPGHLQGQAPPGYTHFAQAPGGYTPWGGNQQQAWGQQQVQAPPPQQPPQMMMPPSGNWPQHQQQQGGMMMMNGWGGAGNGAGRQDLWSVAGEMGGPNGSSSGGANASIWQGIYGANGVGSGSQHTPQPPVGSPPATYAGAAASGLPPPPPAHRQQQHPPPPPPQWGGPPGF